MEFVREAFEGWFDKAWPEYHRLLTEWQAERVRTVSRLLRIDESAVGWAEIVWCHSEHGVPPLEHEAPRFAEVMKMDGRLLKALGGR